MKNPIIAFLLAFFPGGGMLYLGKIMRGLLYFIGIVGLLGIGFVIGVTGGGTISLIPGGLAFLLYIINLVDSAISASRIIKEKTVHTSGDYSGTASSAESERFYTIILSILPGLGHFQLGLMNRGVTLLAAFLGLGSMFLFVTVLTGRGEFLVFLLLLPALWVYSFFDTMQLLKKKENGEVLEDRSILEEFEGRHQDGKKSKAIATFLSMFPGAGHLYLGLQRRGIQLMAAFLFSIYILDALRLGLFLFLVPIIWFYSFFDGLQRASKYGKEPMEDVPVISYFINHQKWIGIGLVFLGGYYLVMNIALPAFSPVISRYINIDLYYWIGQYFQTAVVCVLLIGGGFKLLIGSKKRKEKEEMSE
jgi:hypothetical protein